MRTSRQACLLVAVVVALPLSAQAASDGVAQASCGGGIDPVAPAIGQFQVVDGKIIDPSGHVFIAKGLNAYQNAADPNDILSKFPALNFVRLPVSSLQSPDSLVDFVDTLTRQGVVVEIENHPWPQVNARSGGDLQMVADWYRQLANRFKGNPYVWFGTPNEPQGGDVATEERAVYEAIRSTGSDAMLMMEAGVGGGNPGMVGAGALPSGDYADMHNVAWDLHNYGWIVHFSTDQQKMNDAVLGSAATNSGILGAQTIQSADGKIPVIIGEFGPASVNSAANAQQVIESTAKMVQDGRAQGFAGWQWETDNTDGEAILNGDGSLSQWGQALFLMMTMGCDAGGGVALLGPSGVQGQNEIARDAEAAAAKQYQADMKANAEIGTYQDAGWTADNLRIVRTETSPQGISPVLDPPTDDLSSVYATVPDSVIAATDGNHDIGVSTAGNVVVGTGGVQAVNVTSPSNAIRLGPYDDSVRVSTFGNTIDAGGGSDSITLAYSGSSEDQAGNVIVLPPPGTGTVTIHGMLGPKDKLDLTKALAGTLWDHNPQTLWHFVDAKATPEGCVIEVGGQVVALMPDGSPNDDIGPFIVAH